MLRVNGYWYPKYIDSADIINGYTLLPDRKKWQTAIIYAAITPEGKAYYNQIKKKPFPYIFSAISILISIGSLIVAYSGYKMNMQKQTKLVTQEELQLKLQETKNSVLKTMDSLLKINNRLSKQTGM